MSRVNMLEAKTHLSRLGDAVESGAEKEMIIARNGKTAAKLGAIEASLKRGGSDCERNVSDDGSGGV